MAMKNFGSCQPAVRLLRQILRPFLRPRVGRRASLEITGVIAVPQGSRGMRVQVIGRGLSISTFAYVDGVPRSTRHESDRELWFDLDRVDFEGRESIDFELVDLRIYERVGSRVTLVDDVDLHPSSVRLAGRSVSGRAGAGAGTRAQRS